MGKKMNVPEIRFRGFEEEWEITIFGDIASVRRGLTYKPTDVTDIGIRVLRSSNIDEDKFSLRSDDIFVNKDAVNIELANDNDILITSANGSNRLVGKHCIIHGVQKQTVHGGFMLLCSTNYPFYLNASMSSAWYRKFIINHISGGNGAIGNLSKKSLEEQKLTIPKSTKEQTKIGTFFKNLDSLITLKQRKLDKLKNVKKSMLEKMFPREGAAVPEIRFQGFSGEWERKTLGDLSESFEYGLNAAAKKYDGKNKYIRITDIDDYSRKFLITDLTSPNTYLGNADNYLLGDGDILFARTGASVGKSYLYSEDDGIVYYAGFLIRARIKKDYNKMFVFQNTLSEEYNKFVRLTSQRSGQPGINAQEYSEYKLMTPSLPEQTKIGTFFKNLDQLITLRQKEIEKLKQIKSSCLGKMFV